MAIWVPSVANQVKESEASDARNSGRGGYSLSHTDDKNEGMWRRIDGVDGSELTVIENAVDHEATNEEMLLEDLKVLDVLHCSITEYIFLSFLMGGNRKLFRYPSSGSRYMKGKEMKGLVLFYSHHYIVSSIF